MKCQHLCFKTVFILIILLSSLLLSLSGCSSKNLEKVDWSSLVLGDIIPEAPKNKGGKIWQNDSESLSINLEGITESQYDTYLVECENSGFSIDPDKRPGSYSAFNSDGYYLQIYHIGEVLDINLDCPIMFTTISWPNGTAGKQLPVPESAQGYFSFEYDDSFFVSIGETSKEDYMKYVEACSEAGFIVDYSTGDNYYYADNADGWHLSLNYKGFNIMTVSIDAPDESDLNEPDEGNTSVEPEIIDETLPDVSSKPELSTESNADSAPANPETTATENTNPSTSTEPEISATPSPEPDEPQTQDSLTYSTNDSETAKNGNCGVFSYINKGKNYDIYYIIDFDEGFVYNFYLGNGNDTCEKIPITSGTLNDTLIFTYHDGSDVWDNGLCFKRVRQPNIVVWSDGRGSELELRATSLSDALKIREEKEIVNY